LNESPKPKEIDMSNPQVRNDMKLEIVVILHDATPRARG